LSLGPRGWGHAFRRHVRLSQCAGPQASAQTRACSALYAVFASDGEQRLLERTTRRLRVTAAGAETREHARRSAELSDAIDNIASNHLTKVSGTLRLSAPPSISDSLIAPLVCAFQAEYPDVRVQILITERIVDQVEEGVDLLFRVGALRDSTLVVRRILSYRHQVLANPAYLKARKRPAAPQDLLDHRLLAFSRWKPENRWAFFHVNGKDTTTLRFQPYLSINDYAGIVPPLLAGIGIGELPPLVRPELQQKGQLVEVMPKWRLRTLESPDMGIHSHSLGRSLGPSRGLIGAKSKG